MEKGWKQVSALVLATVMAGSMAACTGSSQAIESSAPTSSAPAAETVAGQISGSEHEYSGDIRFAWWGGDDRHEATEKAIAAFGKKYPGVRIEAEYGAWNGWEEKQSMNILGGNAADVLQVNWNWLDSYSRNGTNFVNLYDYSDILELSQFPEEQLKACEIDGKLMAVPVSVTGRLFYWNKTTFDELGVELPTDEASLRDAGARFKEYNEEYYPLVMNEYDRMIFLVYYLESRYNKPWVEGNELQYTAEQVQEGMEFITSLERDHVIPSTTVILGDMADSLDKNAKWIDGKYAGTYEWDSAASKFEKAIAESVNKPNQEFVLGEFIKVGEYQGGFTKVSQGFSVSANSKSPQASVALVNYLLNDPEGIKISGTERGIPLSSKAVALLNEEGIGNQLVKAANAKVIDYAKFPMDPKFEHNDLKADPDGLYRKIFGKLSTGEIDAAQAAEELIKGVTDTLEGA